MSELPSGWAPAKLHEVCARIVDGSHNPPKPAQTGVPMLSARNIHHRTINLDEYRLISEEDFAIENARTQAAAGDVLLTIVGTIGRTAVVPSSLTPFALQRSVAVLRPQHPINSAYLAYALESPAVQRYLETNAKGTAQKGIYLNALAEVEIPLAPIAEQKRIADKLDAVLAQVDVCRERLARVPAILKRFRQSVLSAAVDGKLTDEWRLGKNPCWEPQKLGTVARFIDYRGKTPTKTAGGIPLITAKNIRSGYLSIEPKEYIAEEDYERWMTRGLPRNGDVLITTEAPLGNVVAIDWDYKFALAQRVICLQFDREVALGEFAAIALQAPNFQRRLHDQATGTTVAGIKASRLKELEIALPSIDEQYEIVRRVNKLLGYAVQLQNSYAAGLVQINKLPPALLSKAFRGELVPKDPNDESASILLERIRAARAATPNNPKQRKKSKTPKKPAKDKATMLNRSEIQANHLSSILKDSGPLTAEALWRKSELGIDDFYEQLKDEEASGLLLESRIDDEGSQRMLEAVA